MVEELSQRLHDLDSTHSYNSLEDILRDEADFIESGVTELLGMPFQFVEAYHHLDRYYWIFQLGGLYYRAEGIFEDRLKYVGNLIQVFPKQKTITVWEIE